MGWLGEGVKSKEKVKKMILSLTCLVTSKIELLCGGVLKPKRGRVDLNRPGGGDLFPNFAFFCLKHYLRIQQVQIRGRGVKLRNKSVGERGRF